MTTLLDLTISLVLWADCGHSYLIDGPDFYSWGYFRYLRPTSTFARRDRFVQAINGWGLFWTVLLFLSALIVSIWFIRHTWRAVWPQRLADFLTEWWRTGSGW